MATLFAIFFHLFYIGIPVCFFIVGVILVIKNKIPVGGKISLIRMFGVLLIILGLASIIYGIINGFGQ